MIDAEHHDRSVVLVDLVHHAVGTATCRVQTGEFTLESAADTMGIVDERCQHELDDRRSGTIGQPCELSLCRGRDSEFVGVVVGHFEAKRARSSSGPM